MIDYISSPNSPLNIMILSLIHTYITMVYSIDTYHLININLYNISFDNMNDRNNNHRLIFNTGNKNMRNNSSINPSNNGINIVTPQSTVSINPYKITNNNTITNVTTASSINTHDLINSNSYNVGATNNSSNESIDDDITNEMLKSTIKTSMFSM